MTGDSVDIVRALFSAPDVDISFMLGNYLDPHDVESFYLGVALVILALFFFLFVLFLLMKYSLSILTFTLYYDGHKGDHYLLIELNFGVNLTNHLLNFLNIPGLVSAGQVGSFGQYTSIVFVAIEENNATTVVEHGAHILHELPPQSLPNRPLRKHPHGNPIVLIDYAAIEHEVLGTPQTGSVRIDSRVYTIEQFLYTVAYQLIRMHVEDDDVEDILPVKELLLEPYYFSNKLSEFFLLETLYFYVEVSLAL